MSKEQQNTMAPDASSATTDGSQPAPSSATSNLEQGQISAKAKTRLESALKGTTAEIAWPEIAVAYEPLIQRWSETCVLRAAAVVLPSTEQEIQSIVKVCREEAVPFVVAGGRHSTSLSSAITDGVVIDLRRMRGITVDAERKTITAEGGATWEEVDVEGGKYGLATVGGTVNHTGIGGLILGGGWGWLSGQYGLTIDNLISVRILLADGRAVTASKEENEDLFWAVRGAGQCFGVVTSFTLQAYDQGPVFAGLLAFTPDKLAKIVEFANWYHANNDGRQAMGFGFSMPPGAPVVAVLTTLFYNGSEEEGKKYFAPLLEQEPLMNQTGLIPYEKVNAMLNQAATWGGRKLFGGSNVVLPLDVGFVQSVYDEFSAFTTGNEKMGESLILFELVPFKKIVSFPPESTACGNRGEYYSVGTVFRWYDEKQDQMVREFNRKLTRRIKDEAGAKKSSGVGQYSNYICKRKRSTIGMLVLTL